MRISYYVPSSWFYGQLFVREKAKNQSMSLQTDQVCFTFFFQYIVALYTLNEGLDIVFDTEEVIFFIITVVNDLLFTLS